jgi:hypothetical protein
MDKITKIASDMNEATDNKYELVYHIAALAKKIVDEINVKKRHDHDNDFGYEFELSAGPSFKKERPVQHAIMVKASEFDDAGLVG